VPINLDKLLALALPLIKRHPDAIVAIVMLCIGIASSASNASPYVSMGLPVAIYALYMVRMGQLGRHKERMARIAIEKLEVTKGIPTRAKAQRALERRMSEK
jgi:hypothetical protein